MNILLLILAFSAFFLAAVLFHSFLRPSGKVYGLILVIAFFLAVEWSSAQASNVRAVFMVVEFAVVLLLAVYAIGNKDKIGQPYGRMMVYVLVGLIVCNFAACMTTYGSLLIFAWSTYDSCKYFAVVFALMAMELKRDDLKALLVFLSMLVLVALAISAGQFFGNESLFEPFRGRYDIVIRSGNFRAIGFFPYPIELGNWATMMFALVYGINRAFFKNKGFSCISFLCLLIAAFSGTRTALMAILVVYLLSNLGTFGKWAKVATVVFAATVCLASFLPVDEILSRLSLDATADLPRQYYFLKGLEVWTGYPLFGIGYGTFGATRYRDLTHDYIFNNYNVHKFDYAGLASTDSFVSEVIPEYGIVGIALLLVIVCIVLKAMRTNGAYAKATSPLLVASLVLAFNSSTAFTSAHVGFYFWLALGLMFSSSGVSLSKRCSLEEDPNDE